MRIKRILILKSYYCDNQGVKFTIHISILSVIDSQSYPIAFFNLEMDTHLKLSAGVRRVSLFF